MTGFIDRLDAVLRDIATEQTLVLAQEARDQADRLERIEADLQPIPYDLTAEGLEAIR